MSELCLTRHLVKRIASLSKVSRPSEPAILTRPRNFFLEKHKVLKNKKGDLCGRLFLHEYVARPGFEPGQTESKSVVLPLYYRANFSKISRNVLPFGDANIRGLFFFANKIRVNFLFRLIFNQIFFVCAGHRKEYLSKTIASRDKKESIYPIIICIPYFRSRFFGETF